MKKAFVGMLATLAMLLLAVSASAETVTENFTGFTAPETPLTAGNATGQGWTYTGGSSYDVGITDTGIAGNSLRLSNARMSGSFGDWVFSKRLATPVSEDANGNEFVATYQIESAAPGHAFQPGLQVSVAPQSGDGARMSYLRFEDTAGGIDVYFVDNQNDLGTPQRAVQVADNLDRTVAHDVKIVLDLYTGPHNDVAQVFIDDMTEPLIPMTVTGFEGFFAPVDHPDTLNKLKAGQSVPMKWKIGGAAPATTWEDYYRFQAESNGGIPQADWTTRPVDSLIFQARGSGTQAGVEGNGFLFDNVTLTSSLTATLPNPSSTPGDPSIYTEPIFTAKQVSCSTGDDIDELEAVATPGASHLTYAGSGVWHYNWQTTNTMKNTCVKLTLNLTGDYALFKIVK
jgi:hypothetical protein